LNQTIEMLRIVGSPFTSTAEMPRGGREAPELYTLAVNNRMPLLYLDALKRQGRLNELEPTYEQRYTRYLRFLDTLVKTSSFLNSLNIEHVVVKTIRPYPATPNDIDILCLGSNHDYREAVREMFQAGYQKVSNIPSARQVKLYHPEDKTWIDLHKEMGVSAIICMDKKRLGKYAVDRELPNGGKIRVLTPEADLALVMLHSLVTEQLYTLAEYYTTLYWLAEMDEQRVGSFISIAKENNITLAARTHIALTAALHEAAYGVVPDILHNVLTELGTNMPEISRFEQNEFKMPYMYRLSTVMKALLEKMRESTTRKSVISQMTYMLNPNFTRFLIQGIRQHRTRIAQEEVY